ncbi:hypothetical protein BHE74_00051237, partial [Ensete ventricosum]
MLSLFVHGALIIAETPCGSLMKDGRRDVLTPPHDDNRRACTANNGVPAAAEG